jgi:hypothetical protein
MYYQKIAVLDLDTALFILVRRVFLQPEFRTYDQLGLFFF